jgi:hypothetical protein
MTRYRDHAMGCLFGFGLVSLLVGCSGPDDNEPFASESSRFSTAPQEPNHEQITATALGFLRPEILSALVAANVSTDVEFVLVNANHFDDCNFSAGSELVSSSQAEAVRHLDPSLSTPADDAQAILAFAHSVHALQDFYAHTNWIESGGEVLVDASLSPFPTLRPYTTIPSSGFVVVQGRKPKNSALYRDTEAAYPTSAVVTFKTKQSRALGLMSGTVDYEPGNYCPDSIAMTHAELNKDKSTNAGREAQFEAAKTLAILQTRHEWCRLSELTRVAWGDAGSARLASWVRADAATPDCSSE